MRKNEGMIVISWLHIYHRCKATECSNMISYLFSLCCSIFDYLIWSYITIIIIIIITIIVIIVIDSLLTCTFVIHLFIYLCIYISICMHISHNWHRYAHQMAFLINWNRSGSHKLVWISCTQFEWCMQHTLDDSWYLYFKESKRDDL